MTKKIHIILSVVLLGAILSACASLPILGTSSASSSTNNRSSSQSSSLADPANLPIQTKLAIGTFKLEGTNLAVTATEAKDLLVLWTAVKVLSTKNTTAPEEMQALYQQIQETMTPEQVKAIEGMNLTSSDIRSLMNSLGIQQAGNFSDAQGQNNGQRTTQSAQSRTNNGGGGIGPGGFAGGIGGGFGENPGQGNTQRTPLPNQSSIRQSLGLTNLFLDPLIKLLQTKAGVNPQ